MEEGGGGRGSEDERGRKRERGTEDGGRNLVKVLSSGSDSITEKSFLPLLVLSKKRKKGRRIRDTPSCREEEKLSHIGLIAYGIGAKQVSRTCVL